MGWGLESFGGSLEMPRRGSSIESFEGREHGIKLVELSKEKLEKLNASYLTEKNDNQMIAYSRFSLAIEAATTPSELDMIFKDIGIYERSEILLYDTRKAFDSLAKMCFCKKTILEQKELKKRGFKAKPLDYIDEINEMGGATLYNDPNNSSNPDEEYTSIQEETTQTNDESITGSSPVIDDEEDILDTKPVDVSQEIQDILNQYKGGSQPPKDKEILDLEIKNILDSLSESTTATIVPTKEPVKTKVHVIKTRKKKVPKKVTIRKITKPGLPGEILEDESNNLTKIR